MDISKRIPGPLVSPEQVYTTRLGTFTRLELYEKYAQTVQGCLTWTAVQYKMYSAAELIMRAVIAMLNPERVKDAKYFSYKLQSGFSTLGYILIPCKGKEEKPAIIIPQFFLGFHPQFPTLDKEYSDDRTGEKIGLRGLLRYIDIIDACLEKSEDYQFDRAVRSLVKAARILTEPEPDIRTREVEDLLWKAAQALGYRLEIATWYKSYFPNGRIE